MKKPYIIAAIFFGIVLLGAMINLQKCQKKPLQRKIIFVIANKREEFKINTLKTSAQAKMIKDALLQQPGISTVDVDIRTKKVSVDYDYRKLSKKEVEGKIKSLGLEPKSPTDNQLRVLQYNVQIKV